MSKRDARAQAKRLHDEVIERLVAQAQERLSYRTLRRRFLQDRPLPADVPFEMAVMAARELMDGATIVRRKK